MAQKNYTEVVPGLWQSEGGERLVVDPLAYDVRGARLEALLNRSPFAAWGVLRAPTQALVNARLAPGEEYLEREAVDEAAFYAGQFQARVFVGVTPDGLSLVFTTGPVLGEAELEAEAELLILEAAPVVGRCILEGT